MTMHFSRPFDEIRPLRLVDAQPNDALERALMMARRFKPVNLTASPVPGIGGLGLVTLSLLTTLTLPGFWWVVLGSMLAGVALGIVLIARQQNLDRR
jgi:hypothetical protein